MKIAYILNHYPKPSHTFIRREIHALEKIDFNIQRFALHGWNEVVPDAEDVEEQQKTFYVLKGGVGRLAYALGKSFLTNTRSFLTSLKLAILMSRGSDRNLAYHLAYLAEACVILPEVRKNGTRHVHAHFATNATEVAMLLHALGGPTYSFTVHGLDEIHSSQGVQRKLMNAAFAVSICSHGRSQLFRNVEYSLWGKVHLIHCGLEQKFFSSGPFSSDGINRYVCVGRLCEEKGQLLLIEAMHRLRQEGVEIELVLAGDGEMRGQISELVKSYDLGDRVRITGWLSSSEVRSEIMSARALVLPSFTEGLPIVIMEAMALCKPVLSTYVGGIPELVIDRLNGWLVPAGSLDDLVSALRNCTNASDDELRSMGNRGFERVSEFHSIDREVLKLSNLFKAQVKNE